MSKAGLGTRCFGAAPAKNSTAKDEPVTLSIVFYFYVEYVFSSLSLLRISKELVGGCDMCKKLHLFGDLEIDICVRLEFIFVILFHKCRFTDICCLSVILGV